MILLRSYSVLLVSILVKAQPSKMNIFVFLELSCDWILAQFA